MRSMGLIVNQPEPTFALLRYLLGGDRPSQTDPLPRSPGGAGVSGPGAERRCFIGGSRPAWTGRSTPPAYAKYPRQGRNGSLQ